MKRVHAFSRNARLFLASTFLYGFMFGLHYLFFNLYILSFGYDQEFVGVLASIPALVTAIVIIPVELFLPWIGYKRSLLLGTGLQMFALLGWAFLTERTPLALASVLFGLGSSLIWISSSSFMAASSTPKERTHGHRGGDRHIGRSCAWVPSPGHREMPTAPGDPYVLRNLPTGWRADGAGPLL